MVASVIHRYTLAILESDSDYKSVEVKNLLPGRLLLKVMKERNIA